MTKRYTVYVRFRGPTYPVQEWGPFTSRAQAEACMVALAARSDVEQAWVKEES